MSLETLLEAAEFLESRGKGVETQQLNHRRPSVTESDVLREENDDVVSDAAAFKLPKSKTKSGKMSPIYVGPPDSFFMRAGTREVHNKLEKNRRAHLKECFDFLKKNIPSLEDKRTSNLGILRSSLRYIQNLKRKEREFELEMQRFAHEKIMLQERMQSLKNELNKMDIQVDLNAWAVSHDNDNETNSTSTATERGTPPPSDYDENDDDEEEAERLVLETNPSPIPKKHRKVFKDFPAPLEPAPGSKLPAVNGFIHKPIASLPGTVVRSPTKSTIPITLSLSGPLPHHHVPMSVIGPIVGTQPSGLGYVTGVPAQGRPSPQEVPLSRMPVTQILHRTLTQRQALMKQASMAAPASSMVSTAPLTAAQLKSPPLKTRTPAVVTLATTQPVTVTALRKDAPVTSVQLVSSGGSETPNSGVTLSTAMPLSFPYYIPKIAHPILVTSLMAPALGVATSTTANSSTPASTVVQPALKVAPKSDIKIKLDPSTSLPVTTVVPSLTDSTVTSVTQTYPMQPIFAPNLLPRQVAWPILANLPRSSVVVATSTGTQPVANHNATVAPAVSSASSQVTSVPLVSLTQLSQLTQMVTPMTVMSPGIQMTPTALTQAQLTSMFASPVLKQFQFPLGLQSSLLQSGQVLGQQVMKPVVVVTVPNIVTQSQPTLATNVAIVSSSSS